MDRGLVEFSRTVRVEVVGVDIYRIWTLFGPAVVAGLIYKQPNSMTPVHR
jgi:hypothetical protein